MAPVVSTRIAFPKIGKRNRDFFQGLEKTAFYFSKAWKWATRSSALARKISG